uniref:Uncharacterized protein n=1 Tax=Tetranychus urticae TaxID=32264 RepID=T1KMQ8_TETUR
MERAKKNNQLFLTHDSIDNRIYLIPFYQ